MNIQQTDSEIPIKGRIARVAELKELEELIDLAANVSSNIDRLKIQRIDRLYNYLFIWDFNN